MTEVTFSDGGTLTAKGTPDELAELILRSHGDPIRITDASDYVHWVNPAFIRSMVSLEARG